MPELPEVETIRRGLAERLPGQTITGVRVRQAQLRHLVDVAALQEDAVGRTISSVERRAKYLLVRLQSERVLVLHLGMTGRLWVGPPADQDAPHDHLISLWDQSWNYASTIRVASACALSRQKRRARSTRVWCIWGQSLSLRRFPVPISWSAPGDSANLSRTL